MPKIIDLASAIIANELSPKTILRRQKQHEKWEHERRLADVRAGSKEPASPASVTERPPLHPITKEAIDQLLHQVDQIHWPLITAMRVKIYYPPDVPVPPQTPEKLLNQIQWYASMLFKNEADQYEQFRSNQNYSYWLSKLAERLLDRVTVTLGRLEEGDSKTLIMGYHGLSYPQVEQRLQAVLLEIRGQYEQGTAPGQHKVDASSVPLTTQSGVEQAVPAEVAFGASEERQALWDAYRKLFPSVSIIQVCWAANQRRREWDRWLKGQKRNDSKPDRMFRSVLTSGKDARVLRSEDRPKDWK